MRFLCCLALLALSIYSSAGEIANVFGEGVFDLRWGNSVSDVQAVFPTGKYTERGSARVLAVSDGRTVLGINREKNSTLGFVFNAVNRLYYVGVVFKGEDYNKIVSKLDQLFGSHIGNEQPDFKSSSIFVTRWPKDEDIEVKLMLMQNASDHISSLSIEYFGLNNVSVAEVQPVNASKNQLYSRYADLTKCLMAHSQMNKDGTRAKSGSVDVAWQQCTAQRRAILEVVPESERAGFEKQLEAVKVRIARSLEIETVAEPGYGRNAKNPVMSGSLKNTSAYFARLVSTENKPVKFKRFGSCCRFPSPNGPFGGHALMDKYEVTYEGLDKPIIVFVNNYDQGVVKPVAGFLLSDTNQSE